MNTASHATRSAHAEPELAPRTFNLVTGTRMRVVDVGAGPQLPLVLIHGFTDSWFSWSRVMSELSVARRVIAVDMRGHGGSSRPAEGYGLPSHAQDILALMDLLGLDRAVVIGHSMGSFVARQIAAMAPERVAGLVLVGSGASPRTNVTTEVEQAVADLPDPVPVEFVREFQYGTIHRPVPDTFMAEVVATSLAVPAHVWRAGLAGMLAGVDESIPPAMPTLVVWGERDQIFSASDQHELLALLPDAALEVYTETGHTPHWECPEQFVADVERFCAQL
jgi:non-heme chloroperoxidase